MRGLRTGLAVLAVLTLVAQLASCNQLALTGPQKYKTDLSATCSRIVLDLDQNGEVSAYAFGKLEKVLKNWEEDFSGKGSFMKAIEIRDLINEAREDPNGAFQKYQAVRMKITEIQSVLQTEVK